MDVNLTMNNHKRVGSPFTSLLPRYHRERKKSLSIIAETELHLPLLRRSPVPLNPHPISQSLLLRLLTVLFQHQLSPPRILHSHLLRLPLPSSPSSLLSLLLLICSHFPSSWRPPHLFHLFLLSHSPSFSLSPLAASQLLLVFSNSGNTHLLWSHILLSSRLRLLPPSSLPLAARSLARSRHISKCALLLRLDPCFSTLPSLNSVVHELCSRKQPDIALRVVAKTRDLITANAETYGFLVSGFCRAGDLVAAAKVWNSMIGCGLEPGSDAFDEIVVTMFKSNRLLDAMGLFKSARERRFSDLSVSSYRAVIDSMCKIGRVSYACMVFAEMLKRGFRFDGATVGHLVYGLLWRKRVKEAYKVFRGAEEVDISLCHGLMKGLLRMRKVAEATDVFREMVRRGIEPNMHTYVMLLQGHMGKRGRKGGDELVNFDSIFVGGLVKAGKTLEASKYAERTMRSSVEVPRFDFNKFLHLYSNEEGVEMFREVGRRLKEVGMVDLGDVLLVYGERMATRERRRKAMRGGLEVCQLCTN